MADLKDLLQRRFEPSVLDPSLQRGLMRGSNSLMDLISSFLSDQEDSQIDTRTGLPPVSIPPPQYSIDPRFQTQIGADPGPRVIGEADPLLMQAMGGIAGKGKGLFRLLETISPASQKRITEGVKKALEKFEEAAKRKSDRDLAALEAKSPQPRGTQGRVIDPKRPKNWAAQAELRRSEAATPVGSTFTRPTTTSQRPNSVFFDSKGKTVDFDEGASLVERMPMMKGGELGKRGEHYAYLLWQRGMHNPRTFLSKKDATKELRRLEKETKSQEEALVQVEAEERALVQSKADAVKIKKEAAAKAKRIEKLEGKPRWYTAEGSPHPKWSQVEAPDQTTFTIEKQLPRGVIQRIGDEYKVWPWEATAPTPRFRSKAAAVRALAKMENVKRWPTERDARQTRRVAELHGKKIPSGHVRKGDDPDWTQYADPRKMFPRGQGKNLGRPIPDIKIPKMTPAKEEASTKELQRLSQDRAVREMKRKDRTVIRKNPSQSNFDKLTPGEQDLFERAIKEEYGERVELDWDDKSWDKRDKLDFWEVGKNAVERQRLIDSWPREGAEPPDRLQPKSEPESKSDVEPWDSVNLDQTSQKFYGVQHGIPITKEGEAVSKEDLGKLGGIRKINKYGARTDRAEGDYGFATDLWLSDPTLEEYYDSKGIVKNIRDWLPYRLRQGEELGQWLHDGSLRNTIELLKSEDYQETNRFTSSPGRMKDIKSVLERLEARYAYLNYLLDHAGFEGKADFVGSNYPNIQARTNTIPIMHGQDFLDQMAPHVEALAIGQGNIPNELWWPGNMKNKTQSPVSTKFSYKEDAPLAMDKFYSWAGIHDYKWDTFEGAGGGATVRFGGQEFRIGAINTPKPEGLTHFVNWGRSPRGKKSVDESEWTDEFRDMINEQRSGTSRRPRGGRRKKPERGPKSTRDPIAERLHEKKLERLEGTPSHFDERGTTLTQEVLNKRFGGPGSPTQRYQGIIHRIGTTYRVYDPVTPGKFTNHASRTLAIRALRKLLTKKRKS